MRAANKISTASIIDSILSDIRRELIKSDELCNTSVAYDGAKYIFEVAVTVHNQKDATVHAKGSGKTGSPENTERVGVVSVKGGKAAGTKAKEVDRE